MGRTQIHLGLFDNIEDAKYARQEKVNELFGEFANESEKINNEDVVFRKYNIRIK